MGSCVGKLQSLRRRGRGEGRATGGVDEVDNPSVVELGPARHPPSLQTPSTIPGTSQRQLITIQYAPASDWGSCAYCDNPTGDRYDFLYCREMPHTLLEDFMEHGWWRTGQIIFKPRMKEVCCPAYAIRLPVADFVPSKSHRRVVRRWRQFLANGDPRWEEREQDCNDGLRLNPQLLPRGGGDQGQDAGIVGRMESTRLHQTAVAGAVGGQGTPLEEEKQDLGEVKGVSAIYSRPQVGEAETKKRVRTPVTPGLGPDPNRPPSRKAKRVRAERKQRKLPSFGDDHTHPSRHRGATRHPPTLQEVLRVDGYNGAKHRLEVKLLPCNPPDVRLHATLVRAYEIYDKFQRIVHPGKVRFESLSEFEWGFLTTPLCNPGNQLMGTYHMQYYLDGELTMLSILDILPTYLVSIYFIYDPDIRFMVPGIYSCLREIDLVQTLQKERPELQYYALGYYNHSSPKVSYKRQFGPQEVLCNETDVFVPLTPDLVLKPYGRLAQDSAEKEGRSAAIDDVVVHTRQGAVTFGHLTPFQKREFQPPLANFIAEAGVSATHRFAIEVAGTL